MTYLLLFILLCPVILIAVLRPALMAVDGGSREPKHIAAAVVGFVVDLVTRYTLWLLFAGLPRRGEWTISDTLERLADPLNAASWRYKPADQIGRWINKCSPTKNHIKILSVPARST